MGEMSRKPSVEENGAPPATTEAPAPAPPAPEEKEPDFDKYYEIFSKPELTDEEEKNHLVKLVKEKRKILVKQLVIKMTECGTGKSAIFKSLSKQYNVKSKVDAPATTVENKDIKENGVKVEEKKEKVEEKKEKVEEQKEKV